MEQNSYRKGNYNRLKRKSTEFEVQPVKKSTAPNQMYNPMMTSYEPPPYYAYDSQNYQQTGFGDWTGGRLGNEKCMSNQYIDSNQYQSSGSMYMTRDSTPIHNVQPPLPDYEPEKPPPPPPPPETSPPRILMDHPLGTPPVWNNRNQSNR